VVATGRDAVVYDAGPGLVARRYRDGRDAAAEGALIRRLHAAGFPVPRVEAVTGPELLMQRLEGPTLGEELLGGAMPPAAAGRLLAELHDRLHALPVGLDSRAVAAGERGAWVSAGPATLHLDLHPFNVLVTSEGPFVIDWSNARTGPAALDVAMSAVILGQVVLEPPPEVDGARIDVAAGIRATLVAMLDAVSDDPLPGLDEAAARRRTDPNMTAAEVAAVDGAVRLIHNL
jgi:aminoglycoside phosphotransferase (APT) family kinase protein